MTLPAPDKRELAQQLFTSETRVVPGEVEASHAQSMAAGERVLQKLRDHLTRWFGADGFDALLARALNQTQPHYPILGKLLRPPEGNRRISGFLDRAPDNEDARVLTDGLVALIATIVSLLSRLIGEDLTAQLLEQIWPAPSRGESRANNQRTIE